MNKPKLQDCTHHALFFDQGGLYLVCSKCQQAWQAVKDDKVTPDFEKRGGTFSRLDVRTDPFKFGE